MLSGEKQKLFEAYLEYADLCINVNPNIPQAVRLLFEVEDFLKVRNISRNITSEPNFLDKNIFIIYNRSSSNLLS